MSSVPYIFVPFIAVICYAFILAALLAAKKNPVVKTFMLWIIAFFFWTVGSLFMRLRLAPGYLFWYNVSILSLFCLPLFIYFFFCSFAKAKDSFLKIIWTLGTVVMLILTYFEVFLDAPEMVTLENGSIIFVYSMDWRIFIPVSFIILIVASIVRIFIKMVREQGVRSPGTFQLFAVCFVMIVGNVVSIVPGNIFPVDTVSGIVTALLLVYALYKKRIFRMTLLISKSVLMLFSGLLVALCFVFLVRPLTGFFVNYFPFLGEYTVAAVAAVCMIMISAVYYFMRMVINNIFYRDERNQSKSIERFSLAAAKTLNTAEVVRELCEVITENINVDRVYVCLASGDKYTVAHADSYLTPVELQFSANNPCIEYLRGDEPCVLLSEFKANSLYRSMWESEKRMLDDSRIECITAVKVDNKIVGLILLPQKPRSAVYNYNEIIFLSTISLIAGISVKNAVLYEQVYRESRYDGLTGLLNLKSFTERLDEDFRKYRNSSLALFFIDLDDFKLYNQLYGTDEGNFALRSAAREISSCVGDKGTVFRYSGKVFAVVIPDTDARSAVRVAEAVKLAIYGINGGEGRRAFKKLTVSCGICVYPYAANSVKELIDNADLATFNAKSSGKSKIAVYSLEDRKTSMLTEGVSIVSDRFLIEKHGDSAYDTYESSIYALSAAIDAKDHYTFRHSQNVARYATILATAVGMNKEHVRILKEAALLHDIGKISIPESILSKNGALLDSEYEIIKGHVNSSIEMIRHLPNMDYVIPAVLGHHERWDGKGYPRGIARDNIPLSARCLAVADAFDAMTTTRSYRKALSIEFAAEQIMKNAGTQFDPELARTFVDLIKSGEITLPEAQEFTGQTAAAV